LALGRLACFAAGKQLAVADACSSERRKPWAGKRGARWSILIGRIRRSRGNAGCHRLDAVTMAGRTADDPFAVHIFELI
jgi:hypothetical protein